MKLIFLFCFSFFISVFADPLAYKRVGKGAPIIIVHGGPGLDHTYLVKPLSKLSDDYELIFYDQRGSGLSFSSKEKNFTIEQFIEDIEDLRIHLGYEKVHLLGHSWGGLLSMAYSLRHPNNVLSLTLVSTLPPSVKGLIAQQTNQQKLLAPAKNRLEQIAASREFAMHNPKAFEEYFHLAWTQYLCDPSHINRLMPHFCKNTCKNLVTVQKSIKKDLLSQKINLYPALINHTLPTLIIHGDHDATPTNYLSPLTNESRFILLEDCGHFPFIECPESFFSEVRKFLASYEGH